MAVITSTAARKGGEGGGGGAGVQNKMSKISKKELNSHLPFEVVFLTKLQVLQK